MERRTVTSSAIRAIGYDGGVLEVEFASGRVYQYQDVPEPVYNALLSADAGRDQSVGRTFNELRKGLTGKRVDNG